MCRIRTEMKEVVPEGDDTLESVSLVGDLFVATYLKDARTVVRLFEVNGRARARLRCPASARSTGFTGKRRDTETFYSFTSFTEPPTIYRYDFKSGQKHALFRPKVEFQSDDYTTEQVFYHEQGRHARADVPNYKKGLKKNGENPTLLYGYGGFDISLTPSFHRVTLVVAGNGRRLCGGEPARRRRVRRGVASGRNE